MYLPATFSQPEMFLAMARLPLCCFSGLEHLFGGSAVSPTCLEADELAGEWSRSGKPRAAAAPPRAGTLPRP